LKTIHPNLSARPFRDYRPVYAVIVTASLLIAFLMLNNIDTYYRYHRETRTTREEIARIERQAAEERRATDAAAQQIGSMDLETLGRRTRFINAQLAERAFSWSELLDRLERVIPNDVRIVSIAPSFDDAGLVVLRLNCESLAADGMLRTINRFHTNPAFANPFPGGDQQSDGIYRFDLSVTYKPSVPRVVKR
jgi:hypothetical protein